MRLMIELIFFVVTDVHKFMYEQLIKKIQPIYRCIFDNWRKLHIDHGFVVM